MGGNTSGSAISAPIGPLNRDEVRASHHANGAPKNNSKIVTVVANRSVRSIAATSASLNPISITYYVAIGFNDRTTTIASYKGQKF